MIKIIEKSIEKYPEATHERGLARMTFMCDEQSELPVYNAMPIYDIAMGSMAYVIRQGKTYLMDSNHVWYSTDGASA